MLNRSPLFIPYSGGEGEGLSGISKEINRLDIEKKKNNNNRKIFEWNIVIWNEKFLSCFIQCSFLYNVKIIISHISDLEI